MDPIIIAVIAGACGLICAGFMTYYVLGQPQTCEASDESGDYLWAFQADKSAAGVSQQESEEAVSYEI